MITKGVYQVIGSFLSQVFYVCSIFTYVLKLSLYTVRRVGSDGMHALS